MKKIITKLKNNSLFIFIIGGIIFGSIGIYAASLYYAKDISYEPTDASWKVNNVSDALNDLYEYAGSDNALIFAHATTDGVKSYTIEKAMKNGLIFINDIRDGYSIISVNGVEIANERIITSDRNGYMALGELKIGDVLTVQWSGASPVAGYYTWILVDAIPNKID